MRAVLVQLGALLVAGALVARPARVVAQSQDYWGNIETTVTRAGGWNGVGRLPPPQLSALTWQLLQRADAYLDLHALERELARDHLRWRDSIARATGRAFGATPYFLARALHESGNLASARAQYRRALTSGDPRLRELAQAWLGALDGRGRGWQRELVDWRAGQPAASAMPCPPSAPVQCRLFRAVVTGDIGEMTRLQRELSRASADFSESQPVGGATLSLEFVDPVTMWLLAMADYRLIVHLTGKGTDATRGLALLRLGQVKDAEGVLRAAGSGVLVPYIGEARFRQEDRRGADDLWRSASGPAAMIALDVRSALGVDSAEVARQASSVYARGPLQRVADVRQGGLYLARALLRADRGGEADDLMTAMRRLDSGNDPLRVPASILILTAHAAYRHGQVPNFRDRYGIAREYLAGLARVAPIVGLPLRMLQELTTTVDAPAVTR